MYVYQQSEAKLWTVGFNSPDGQFMSESSWDTPELAAKRVNYLNGGSGYDPLEKAVLMIAQGLVSNSPDWSEKDISINWVAINSVKYAKAILQEANK